MDSSFNFQIANYLKSAIEISPASLEDIEKYKLLGDIIIQPPTKRVFPKINLQEKKVSIDPEQKKSVTAKLSEIDFSLIGLSTGESVVQRIQIVDIGSKTIAGYLSFRCTVYNTNPFVTMESCTGYKILEENFPFGGGSIHISIKKDPSSNF